ncbi:hypothetical protein R80B4_02897 [Fibrobacteres bacterium R8-0-B4]
MGSGKVYVVHNDWIQNPDAEDGYMTYKIGMTTDSVSNRYYGLGLKMPSEFECDFAYEFDSEKYKDVEKALHKILNESNVGGEWFDLSDNTLDGVQSICKLAGGKLITDAVESKIAEEEELDELITRETWMEKSKWTVETADCLKELMSKEGIFECPSLRYKIDFIAVSSSRKYGFDVYFYLRKIAGEMSSLFFFVGEEKRDELIKLLEEKNIRYKLPKRKRTLQISIDKQLIEQHNDVFIKIAEYIKDYKKR